MSSVELNEDLAGLPTYSHSTQTSNSVYYLNVGRPKAVQMIEKSQMGVASTPPPRSAVHI